MASYQIDPGGLTFEQSAELARWVRERQRRNLKYDDGLVTIWWALRATYPEHAQLTYEQFCQLPIRDYQVIDADDDDTAAAQQSAAAVAANPTKRRGSRGSGAVRRVS